MQYKRKYELWVLVLLIIVCWPAALIYYFTRDMVAVQEFPSYATPYPGQPQYYAPPTAQAAPQSSTPTGTNTACPRCGRPAVWVAQYGRWYCSAEQTYL